MVDLRAKPYLLKDADIAWVESTIASMTAEEKVGQLFWQLTAGNTEEYLQDLMQTYHLGGCRYNAVPGQMVLNQNRILQKHAKVPVFIACNPEQGGNGVCPDGTFVSDQIKIGATRKPEYAQAMDRISGVQLKATGCNMAVAPAISKDCLTLVKYKDADVLPLSPEKTKRVMIVNVKGPDSPMAKLAAIAMGGGEIPWYVHEIPVVGISVNKPTMLADTPMLRTYINTYDSNDDTMDALVDALLADPEAFKGTAPIDSYCGLWDTHM